MDALPTVPLEHSAGGSAPIAAPIATGAADQITGSSEQTPERVARPANEAAETEPVWEPEHLPEDHLSGIPRLRRQIEHADTLAARIVAASVDRASQYQVAISVAHDAYQDPDASIASLTAAYNADRHAEQINFNAAGWMGRRARVTPTEAVLHRALGATEARPNARLMAQTIRLHPQTWIAVAADHPLLGAVHLRQRLQAHDQTDPDPEWYSNPHRAEQVLWTEHPAVRLQNLLNEAEQLARDNTPVFTQQEQDSHGGQPVPGYSPFADSQNAAGGAAADEARRVEAPAVLPGEAPPPYDSAPARGAEHSLPPPYHTVAPPRSDETTRDTPESASARENRARWLATNTAVDVD